MKNQPLVSVCCITYNHEKYIRDAIEGFLMQETDFLIEIIIHDDASTDRTQEIIREYAVKDDQIIPILREKNIKSTGVAVFPVTFEKARGKYIAMCEGDDYWTDPLKLQKQIDFLENNSEYGLVHTNFDTLYQNTGYIINNTHSVIGVEIKEDCKVSYWNLFGKAMATIKTPTVCFRNNLCRKWMTDMPENKWMIGDFPMYFYISLNSKIGYINKSTSVYRTVPTGTASNVGKDNSKKLKIRKTYVDIRLYFYEKHDLNEDNYKKALVRDLNILLNYCILTGEIAVFNEYHKIFKNKKWEKDVGLIIKYYIKYDNYLFLLILRYALKLKIYISERGTKIMKPKLLWHTIRRRLIRIYV